MAYGAQSGETISGASGSSATSSADMRRGAASSFSPTMTRICGPSRMKRSAILFGLYIPEFIPSEVRLRASGVRNRFGRGATIVSPIIIRWLFQAKY